MVLKEDLRLAQQFSDLNMLSKAIVKQVKQLKPVLGLTTMG